MPAVPTRWATSTTCATRSPSYAPTSTASGSATLRSSAAAQAAAGGGEGELAVVHDRHAVHHDVAHTGGVHVRVDERGVVADRRRVEHHDVGKPAGCQPAPVAQAQVVGRAA